jgi:enoyl-CoA hydratase/carnithine racemase
LLEDLIPFQNGDDLVIGLIIVDQTEPSDRTSFQNYVAARDVMLAQYKYVQRIVVSVAYLNTRLAAREVSDPTATIGARDESIVRRNDIRILLRPIDLQITSVLIHFVLDRVTRDDLDKDRDFFRGVHADLDAVPRMRFVGSEHSLYYLARTPRMSNAVIIEEIGHSIIVRFNRPEIRSPLSIDVLDRLAEVVGDIEKRNDVGKVIVTGVGNVFASGADLREVAKVGGSEAREFAERGQLLMARISTLPPVTIAAVNGVCFGGALDLALACKRRVASPDATFAHPGADLGIITGWGGTQRLPRLIGEAGALEIFFTAKRVTADQALAIGLIDEIATDPVSRALNDLA